MSEPSERPSGRAGDQQTLAEWRILRKLSPAQLARAAGASQQMIWRIEAGKSTPNILLALALGRALGVSVYDILWPETARYGVGSKPSIAQATYQQRMREERAEQEEAERISEREASNNPSDTL